MSSAKKGFFSILIRAGDVFIPKFLKALKVRDLMNEAVRRELVGVLRSELMVIGFEFSISSINSKNPPIFDFLLLVDLKLKGSFSQS